MVIYKTTQQQTNDIFTFAMSLLFMGFVFGLVKSLVAEDVETAVIEIGPVINGGLIGDQAQEPPHGG